MSCSRLIWQLNILPPRLAVCATEHTGEHETRAALVYLGRGGGVIIPATTWLDFSLTLNPVAAWWKPAKPVAALLPAGESSPWHVLCKCATTRGDPRALCWTFKWRALIRSVLQLSCCCCCLSCHSFAREDDMSWKMNAFTFCGTWGKYKKRSVKDLYKNQLFIGICFHSFLKI